MDSIPLQTARSNSSILVNKTGRSILDGVVMELTLLESQTVAAPPLKHYSSTILSQSPSGKPGFQQAGIPLLLNQRAIAPRPTKRPHIPYRVAYRVDVAPEQYLPLELLDPPIPGPDQYRSYFVESRFHRL